MPRTARSFKPRYPAWLMSPSFLYYAMFFLGPMAILVVFSSTAWSPTLCT